MSLLKKFSQKIINLIATDKISQFMQMHSQVTEVPVKVPFSQIILTYSMVLLLKEYGNTV